MQRAWYGETIERFVASPEDHVLGELLANCQFSVLQSQRDAWVSEIRLLRSSLAGVRGSVYLEFSIPRMGRRVDAVLLVDATVFVIEFKVGAKEFDRSSIDQVWDYALDLKNFHEASHEAPVVPILIATDATGSPPITLKAHADLVYYPVMVDPGGLRGAIDSVLGRIEGHQLNSRVWSEAPYHPTPTIVEAARALYAQHSVEAIARSDAGAKNLHATSQRIELLVTEAREKKQKLICFVTGVPGAGKTLVGLNLATRGGEPETPTHAVFLSGNGPLVAVLREALTRDAVARQGVEGKRVRKGEVSTRVKAFIQNVHHFRDEALLSAGPPPEHVVIFDEAQRAWNLRQTANFMNRKRQKPGFSKSEPEFLMSYMDRHRDWSVVVCLVGGGQEINTGEAGIAAWLQAVNSAFPRWHMHISSKLTDSEYASGTVLDLVRRRQNVSFDDSLHLAVSMRSFRAEDVSGFVKALLDCEKPSARRTLASVASRFPILLTRDLNRAKQWIRDNARGTERFGIVASSRAQRLKPHAIDIRVAVDPIHWFLNDRKDTRSSYYLEDVATEFQVQGLELDWTCVTWDADLRYRESGWSFHDFRGSRWTNISNEDNRTYLKNAYRVLLTRARQGMVIFVPQGDADDPTRASGFYDSTFRYLADLGIPILA
jgi:hypothetical protein